MPLSIHSIEHGIEESGHLVLPGPTCTGGIAVLMLNTFVRESRETASREKLISGMLQRDVNASTAQLTRSPPAQTGVPS